MKFGCGIETKGEEGKISIFVCRDASSLSQKKPSTSRDAPLYPLLHSQEIDWILFERMKAQGEGKLRGGTKEEEEEERRLLFFLSLSFARCVSYYYFEFFIWNRRS